MPRTISHPDTNYKFRHNIVLGKYYIKYSLVIWSADQFITCSNAGYHVLGDFSNGVIIKIIHGDQQAQVNYSSKHSYWNFSGNPNALDVLDAALVHAGAESCWLVATLINIILHIDR